MTLKAEGVAERAPKQAQTGLCIKAAPGLKLRDRKVTRLAVKGQSSRGGTVGHANRAGLV
jgi:hypothetical protein